MFIWRTFTLVFLALTSLLGSFFYSTANLFLAAVIF